MSPLRFVLLTLAMGSAMARPAPELLSSLKTADIQVYAIRPNIKPELPPFTTSNDTNKQVRSDRLQILALSSTLLPITDKFDYKQAWEEALHANPHALPVSAERVVVTTQGQNGTPPKHGRVAPGQVQLTLDSQYLMSSDWSTLDTLTTVDVWTEQDFGQDFGGYRVALRYQSAPMGGDRKAAAAAWTADDGQLLKKTLRESIDETVRMLALILKPTKVPLNKSQPFSLMVKYERWQMSGQLFDQGGGRALLVDSRDRYYSLPESDLPAGLPSPDQGQAGVADRNEDRSKLR